MMSSGFYSQEETVRLVVGVCVWASLLTLLKKNVRGNCRPGRDLHTSRVTDPHELCCGARIAVRVLVCCPRFSVALPKWTGAAPTEHRRHGASSAGTHAMVLANVGWVLAAMPRLANAHARAQQGANKGKG